MGNEWNSETIRGLRLRLGFSASDLARRLQCQCEEIRSWELGVTFPEQDKVHQLELMMKQADQCSHEVSQKALVDRVLDQRELGQVALSDLKIR